MNNEMDVDGTLQMEQSGPGFTVEGRLAITRDRPGLARAEGLERALRAWGVTPAPTAPIIPWSSDDSVALDGLTIENSADRITIYGRLNVPTPAAEAASALAALAAQCREILSADPTLAEAAGDGRIDTVANPFG